MSAPKASAQVLPFVRMPTPQEGLLAMLEVWADKVRAGEIHHLGIVGISKTDKTIETQFFGWGGALLGPIQVLNARCLEDMRG